MPNPVMPVPPGGSGGSNQYPQWGLDTKSGKIVKAENEQQKLTFAKKGYLDWFMSEKAAQNAWKGMQGVIGSGGNDLPNPLHGIDDVGATLEAFFRVITDFKMWRSVGWIWLGFTFLAIGVLVWLSKSGLLPKLNSAPIPLPV